MAESIVPGGAPVRYTLKRSSRSKSLRLGVSAESGVVVTAPRYVPKILIERFVRSNAGWIKQHLTHLKGASRKKKIQRRSAYLKHKETARTVVHERLVHYSAIYGISYNMVRIGDQRTRWGSCSARGNLNFNYRIVFLTKKQADYIIVHELCHIQELNHSERFWRLVAREIPDHKVVRKQLKEKEGSLFV